MLKVVWRFNLRADVRPDEFWPWLQRHIWASSAAYGCSTQAFQLRGGAHAWSTEATWPSESARQRWNESSDFAMLPSWPGSDSPWGAQVDMEMTQFLPLPE
jgi:hypothetical protein